MKVGDKVKRIVGEFNGMKEGDIDEVTSVCGSALGGFDISLKKFGYGHASKNFKVITSSWKNRIGE